MLIRPAWLFSKNNFKFWRHYDRIHALAKWACWARDMSFKIHMCSGGLFSIFISDNVNIFAFSSQQLGNFFVSCSVWWPPYEFSPLLSLSKLSIFAYYSSVILGDKIGGSDFCYPAITEYCGLAVMRFILFARDGANGYQCANSFLPL